MQISPPTVEPNHELNFRVPELDDDDVVAACYMQLESKIVNGGVIFITGNWFPNCRLFKNEYFLAALGLNLAFPKGNLAEGVQFAY